MAWLVQCSQDSFFFFLISDIKLEALRNRVASGGAHISLFGCLMLVLQQAVVAGPSPFSLTLNWLMPGFISVVLIPFQRATYLNAVGDDTAPYRTLY